MIIQWREVRNVNLTVRKFKKRLTTNIMRKVKPLMWETGYCKNLEKKEHYNGFFFADDKGKMGGKIYKIGTLEVIGFMEGGRIATDAYAGGLATQHLSSISIEDLIKLWAFIESDRYNLFKKEKQ